MTKTIFGWYAGSFGYHLIDMEMNPTKGQNRLTSSIPLYQVQKQGSHPLLLVS